MIRFSTIIWLILVAATGYAMFQVKYQVSQLDEKLAHINRQIADDQEAIHVLKAEWAFLNQPNRLAALNQRYLGLGPIGTKMLASLDTPPLRAAPDADNVAAILPPTPPMKPVFAPERAGTRIAQVSFKVQP